MVGSSPGLVKSNLALSVVDGWFEPWSGQILSPGLVKSNLALSVVDGWFEPWSGQIKSCLECGRGLV